MTKIFDMFLLFIVLCIVYLVWSVVNHKPVTYKARASIVIDVKSKERALFISVLETIAKKYELRVNKSVNKQNVDGAALIISMFKGEDIVVAVSNPLLNSEFQISIYGDENTAPAIFNTFNELLQEIWKLKKSTLMSS